MKISKTQIGVSLFIILGICALFAASSYAETYKYLELGHTGLHSQSTVGGAGVRLNGEWDFHVGLIGEGETDDGQVQEQVFFYSASRIVSPRWYVLGGEFKQRIGIARTKEFVLIGDNNYRLGLILHYRVFELEFFHYSSANINPINTGVDGLTLRVFL